MLPQQYCLRWKYHHSNLQTMFSQLLDRGCFCDVTLACEGQLIRAHRVVLCACSTFFDTVLTNYASERDPIIIMKDVTFADVKCLIEFMYKGEINVEHAHLASLLKTADDLKIKGLAEVSWRDDEDGPPPPTPATEFHSPTRAHDSYLHHEQQRASPLHLDHQLSLQQQRERKSISPKDAHSQPRMPTLTPISTTPNMSIAAAAAAVAAAASSASPVEHYLGPKRKRGRPPLDDAYDVFNVRKMAQYSGQLEPAHSHNQHHQAYAYSDEAHRLAAASPAPTSTAAAAAAYQQHIHQQQTKQRMRHLQRQQRPSESEEAEDPDTHGDPEWITSNLEVNVGDCEQAANSGNENADINTKENKMAELEEKELTRVAKSVDKKRRERTSQEREKLAQSQTRAARKHSTVEQEAEDQKDDGGGGGEGEHVQQEQQQQQSIGENSELAESRHELDDDETPTTVPQPVEDMESGQQSLEVGKLAGIKGSAAPTPAALHHAHYGKYAPEGYMLNEHGMLMTHDFVHAGSAAAGGGVASSSGSGAAANGSEQDYVDIKMEDYDATDLRLTSEEMSQWQDVIKMDDYLAKGRRPQFWEEPFTRRVLDAIKNKRLEMKKAARILGVSYGTLYGRYREVYGCLKHPYSSSTFRPSQASQLAAQPRFDIVWPSPKRDGTLLPGQLEIGKLRPKDLSELWARPQL